MSPLNNWKLIKLEEVTGDNGLFVDGDWVESKDQDPNGNVRLIQLADVGVGCFIDKSARFLTSTKAAELRCTYLEPGDLLIARMPDPIGRACIFPDAGQPCVTVVDVCIVRPDPSKVDSRWLMRIFNSPNLQRKIGKYTTGTTRKRISRKNLQKLTLNLPPLPEQKRIAAILDKADAIRRNRKKAISLTEEFLRSAFLDMFGDPVSSSYPVLTLSEVCMKITDGTHCTPSYIDVGVPFLRVKDIKSGQIDWSIVKRISTDEHHMLMKRCHPEYGDVLYSKNGTIGIPKLVDWHESFSIFVSLALLKPNRDIIEGGFIESFFRTPYALRQATWHSKTLTVTNLHLEEIREIQLPVPPINEQQNWLRLKDSVILNKLNQEQVSVKVEDLFNSLVQRAFRGELTG